MDAEAVIAIDLPPPAFQDALKALHRLAQLDGDEVPGRLLGMTAETSAWPAQAYGR